MTDPDENGQAVPLILGPRERRAFVCVDAASGLIHKRVFLDPTEPNRAPRCEAHGKMVKQPNRPYNPPTETSG